MSPIETSEFELKIITPLKEIFQETVNYVRIPCDDGYWGILSDHAPYVMSLQTGEVKVKREHKTYYFATSGGIAEVLPDKLTLLLENAEESSSIDVDRAKQSMDRALQRLREKPAKLDIKRAQASLRRAKNRLKISDQS